MPYTIRYTDSGAEVRTSGVVTAAKIAAARAEVARHAYQRGRRYVLIDHSGASRFELDARDIETLGHTGGVAEFWADPPPLLLAAIVPQREGYELARAWQTAAAAQPIESRIFRVRAMAVAWLASRGVPDVELVAVHATEAARVRTFRDAAQVTWSVTERAAPPIPNAPAARCLVFTSDVVFRRVWTYPADWFDLSAEALEALSWGK